MTRLRWSSVFVVALGCFVAYGAPTLKAGAGSSTVDPNAYFNALTSRSDLFKAYSLRDQAQLLSMRSAVSQTPSVTYDPANDPYPDRQDAAKVVIPAFVDLTTLAAPAAPGDATVTLTETRPTYLSTYVNRRQIRVDGEIMTVTGRSGSVLTVTRGSLGTPAASHLAGQSVAASTNSLPNQIFMPLGTQDGHTYVATWDAWYGKELVHATNTLTNWKSFRFDSPRNANGGNPGFWFQVNNDFAQAPTPNDVGTADARAAGPVGGNVTKLDPLLPQIGTFVVHPETWIRYWVTIDQRANDWDLVSLWVADENHDPVKIIDQAQLENFGGAKLFRVEFNTSTYNLTANRGDFVLYVRNFAMLQDVSNPTALMQRPFASAPLPPPTSSTLSAPRNLHIVH